MVLASDLFSGAGGAISAVIVSVTVAALARVLTNARDRSRVAKQGEARSVHKQLEDLDHRVETVEAGQVTVLEFIRGTPVPFAAPDASGNVPTTGGLIRTLETINERLERHD